MKFQILILERFLLYIIILPRLSDTITGSYMLESFFHLKGSDVIKGSLVK